MTYLEVRAHISKFYDTLDDRHLADYFLDAPEVTFATCLMGYDLDNGSLDACIAAKDQWVVQHKKYIHDVWDDCEDGFGEACADEDSFQSAFRATESYADSIQKLLIAIRAFPEASRIKPDDFDDYEPSSLEQVEDGKRVYQALKGHPHLCSEFKRVCRNREPKEPQENRYDEKIFTRVYRLPEVRQIMDSLREDYRDGVRLSVYYLALEDK